MLNRRNFFSTLFGAAAGTSVVAKSASVVERYAKEVEKYGQGQVGVGHPHAASLPCGSIPVSYYTRKLGDKLYEPKLGELIALIRDGKTDLLKDVARQIWNNQRYRLVASGYREQPHEVVVVQTTKPTYVCSVRYCLDVGELTNQKLADMVWCTTTAVADELQRSLNQTQAEFPDWKTVCANYGPLEVYPEARNGFFEMFCRVATRTLLVRPEDA